MKAIAGNVQTFNNVAADNYNLTEKTGVLNGPAKLTLTGDAMQSFAITLANSKGEQVVCGYDQAKNEYYIDRTKSGKTDFEKGFAARHTAPRFSTGNTLDYTLIIDDASVEMFADGGLSVMTEVFFPNENYSNITITSPGKYVVQKIEYTPLKIAL